MEVRIKNFPIHLKIPIFFFSLYTLLGPFVNFGYHISKVGIGTENVLKYYKGNIEEGIPPQSIAFFFEVMHFHTWAQSAVIFILTIIFSLTSIRRNLKIFFTILVYISSFIHIVSPIITRFFFDFMVYAHFVAVLSMSFSFIFMSLVIMKDILS